MKNHKDILNKYINLLYLELKNNKRTEIIRDYYDYFDYNVNKPYINKKQIINSIIEQEYSYKQDYSLSEIQELIKTF
jgi:hypothetical protein